MKNKKIYFSFMYEKILYLNRKFKVFPFHSSFFFINKIVLVCFLTFQGLII